MVFLITYGTFPGSIQENMKGQSHIFFARVFCGSTVVCVRLRCEPEGTLTWISVELKLERKLKTCNCWIAFSSSVLVWGAPEWAWPGLPGLSAGTSASSRIPQNMHVEFIDDPELRMGLSPCEWPAGRPQVILPLATPQPEWAPAPPRAFRQHPAVEVAKRCHS